MEKKFEIQVLEILKMSFYVTADLGNMCCQSIAVKYFYYA